MRSQLTPEGIALLCSALVLFWGTIGVLVRRHARHRHGPTSSRRT
jgi:hypothetical protein